MTRLTVTRLDLHNANVCKMVYRKLPSEQTFSCLEEFRAFCCDNWDEIPFDQAHHTKILNFVNRWRLRRCIKIFKSMGFHQTRITAAIKFAELYYNQEVPKWKRQPQPH